MPKISDYSSLVTALDGNTGWLHKSNLTARIPEFIGLAESDMQVRCKLVEFELSASVAVTAGSGNLPSDFLGMRSAYWDGNFKQPLDFIVPDRFDLLRNTNGSPRYYTIAAGQIRVAPSGTGNVAMTYNARFTPISATMGTNSIINNFPDAYLFGSLRQAALWAKDWAAADRWSAELDGAVARIRVNNTDRRFAGGNLQVRPR